MGRPLVIACAVLAVMAFALGITVIAVTSMANDRMATLAAQRDDSRNELTARQADFLEREQVVAAAESTLASRESELALREAAVVAAEAAKAAGEISQGVWTAGVDIAPGTYQTTAPVRSCYWAITRGDEVLGNDVVTEGRPRVRLSEGQTLRTQDCGSWTKIG